MGQMSTVHTNRALKWHECGKLKRGVAYKRLLLLAIHKQSLHALLVSPSFVSSLLLASQ